MDLNLFSTQLTATNGKAGKVALSGSNALGGNGGLNVGVNAFWNVILGNITTDEIAVKADSNNDNAAANGDAIKKEKVDLALLQLALMGQDPDQTLDQKLSDLQIERLVQNKENRVAQLTKLIDHLTSGLPQSVDQSGSIEELVSRLEKRLEKLQASLESFRTGDFGDEGAPFQLLIATGLDPNQITRITNRIQEVESKLGRKLTVEDLIAGVGNIIPVPGDEDAPELSTAEYLDLFLNQEQKTILENLKGDKKTHTDASNQNKSDALNFSQSEIEAQLQLLAEAKAKTEKKDGTISEFDLSNLDLNDLDLSKFDLSEDDLDLLSAGIAAHLDQTIQQDAGKKFDLNAFLNLLATIKIAPASSPTQNSKSSGDGADKDADVVAGAAASLPVAEAPLSERLTNEQFKALFSQGNILQNLQNLQATNKANVPVANIMQSIKAVIAANQGALSVPSSTGTWTIPADDVLSQTLGFDIHTGAPYNPNMVAVQASTSIPQAGQTHPATQTVAAHIYKSAQSGETGKIVLQLDPPELGRVEVRLEFGKDKSVKAHMIVEKPETYLMLQRDAVALERALQNAGLDTDSGSLNYQMAEDNYAFNNGNSQNGGNSAGGQNAAGYESDDVALIETTMTWNVDQETGHIRYSLLA